MLGKNRAEKRAEKKANKKHNLTLGTKLVRRIALILIFVMSAIIFATYQGLDVVYLVFSGVKSLVAAREIEQVCEKAEPSEFAHQMDAIEREYEINVEIYTGSDNLVYSSTYKGEMTLPPYSDSSISLPDSEKKDFELVMDLGEAGNNAFCLSRDTDSGRDTEYLVCTWSIDSGITLKLFKLKTVVDTNSRIAVAFISFVTIVVVMVALIVIMVFVMHTTKPLKEMSEITNNMAMLDFSQKCKRTNVKELSDLADSINDMSGSLETALVDLRERNKKLQKDIEQEKTIDQLRQVFISGVSHELKTPIAIIQGYAEGLKVFMESDPATAEKYCDTIISETERMNNLVMKLLDIIKYESGEYVLSYSEFNIREIIDEWYVRNSEILKEKNITAVNDTDRDFIGFGDSFIISTVVNNYLSNAVSHVSGDMIIRATAQEMDNDIYRVSIFNTGTPIAERDIDKIWNSFYRADKAMSRSQGRFGLGLAIVAAIQKLHDRSYGVINHEDGVEFWFDVKKYTGDPS